MSDSSAQGDNAIWRDWLRAINKPGIGAVIALTIIGGVLRFIRLAHPPLLFDEAATYTRVTGTFKELLNILRDDGFAPLHYELYWLMSRFARLTPVMMRIVPAICGTLMIPATYFLARQMVSRRVARLAAAITCCSAWMLVYSRDAKMYMELWLCATLFVASLLWWMRAPSRVAWLAFVAAGCAMNGLHALGLCVTGVAVVIVLTHPLLDRRRLALALLGLFITCSGIAGHYALFSRFQQTIATEGFHTAGLDWIAQRNQHMNVPFLLWDTMSSWMLAYRSPRPPIEPPHRVIAPVAIVSGILYTLLAIGIWRWPRRLRDDDPDDAPPGRGALWMTIWLVLPLAGCAIISAVGGHDVWNARYLAVVWPALVVLVSMAILRLPAPWLRSTAIALLIGANLLQYGLRVSVESGIPVDQISRDLATAKASSGRIRAVVAAREDPRDNGIGGGGGIFDFPGRYYMAMDQHLTLRPHQLRDQSIRKHVAIAGDVGNLPPTVERVIVWSDGRKTSEDVDPFLKALGPGWTRASVQEHTVRDFWCWRSMFRCTRGVYVLSGEEPATDAAPPHGKKRGKSR